MKEIKPIEIVRSIGKFVAKLSRTVWRNKKIAVVLIMNGVTALNVTQLTE
jgi:hypothetical protein